MKRTLLIIICSFALNAYAQRFEIEYSVGCGTYQMNEMKAIQLNVFEQFKDSGAKITDSFPGNISHNAAIGFLNQDNYCGVNFSYTTTGGRIHVADYSGSYTGDMILSGYRLGAFYRYYMSSRFEQLKFFVQVSPGAVFSILKTEDKLQILGESQSESSRFNSIGFFLEPSLGVRYQLLQTIGCFMQVGYEQDVGGKLRSLEQKSNVEVDWSGFRINVGIVISLPYVE